jgi:hypothetical protein
MEKILISRINYLAYFTKFINTKQHGFTPHRNAVDEAMSVKDTVDEGLLAEEVIILHSLDIETAFDAVWWPKFFSYRAMTRQIRELASRCRIWQNIRTYR